MSDPRLFAELDADERRKAFQVMKDAKVAMQAAQAAEADAKAFIHACRVLGWKRDTNRNANKGEDVIAWAHVLGRRLVYLEALQKRIEKRVDREERERVRL